MRIKLLIQPTPTSCGQTCLAMVSGMPIERAIRIVGHSHSTCPAELVAAIRSCGYSCPSRLARVSKRGLPELCIARLSARNAAPSWGHWVVVYKGNVYDPAGVMNPAYPKPVHMTSYLPIVKAIEFQLLNPLLPR